MCKKSNAFATPVSAMMQYAYQIAKTANLTTKTLTDFYSSSNIDATYTPAVIVTANLDPAAFIDATAYPSGILVTRIRIFGYPNRGIVISGSVNGTDLYTDYPVYLFRTCGYVVQPAGAVAALAAVYELEVVGADNVGFSIDAPYVGAGYAVMSTLAFKY